MGIFDKVKGAFGVNDDEDLDEEEYEEEEEETEEEEPAANTFKADFSQAAAPAPKKERASAPVTGKSMYVLVKPTSYEESVEIADNVNAKKTVVINLEDCEGSAARRIIDFISGVAYANGAKITPIANAAFIVTPANSDISGLGNI